MQIIPVAGTAIDWTKFVTSINAVTGRSPTRLLDQSRMPVGDVSSYVAAIAYFCCGCGPTDAKNYSPTIFKHVNYSFLMEITEKQYLTVLRETELYFTDNYFMKEDDEKIILVTGNLIQWRSAIVTFCSESQNPKLRSLFNAFYLYFLSQGLGDLFSSYSKKALEGDTFVLKEI